MHFDLTGLFQNALNNEHVLTTNKGDNHMKTARTIALVAISMAAALGMPAAAVAQTATTTTDSADVYKAFLHHWRGKNRQPINVARVAEPMHPEGEDGGCEGHPDIEALIKSPAERIDDLSQVLGPDPSIHYVDRSTWHPTDPQHMIDQGKKVDAAVNAGMSAALLTFSAIAFNEHRDVAVFRYGFVCGRLCGSGAITVMRKNGSIWESDPRQCAQWISETMPLDRQLRIARR
ncbi:hypothetical protein L2Y96_12190 [Luteibacter aegosomaticola]|uniref:hypothetical protein n=1 Tax=Luteibacter aegosomaticola TaxID=2911538 RepID=UPI001FFAAE7C|nr:hypothetical protein [Luteibacter aegosomaticola]UPG88179.1 hypothetical protein L2Y96_12190 [Luteibacter aegosomaticola]